MEEADFWGQPYKTIKAKNTKLILPAVKTKSNKIITDNIEKYETIKTDIFLQIQHELQKVTVSPWDTALQ